MNQTDIAKIAKQHRQYRTEALAKRQNLVDVATLHDGPNMLVSAITLNDATMMIIRTEAKAKAMEELAETLGIDLEEGE